MAVLSAIAIIPARGGSTRIPRKNIRPFHGKPIIAYSIAAALACELFDDIFVSSDDQEILSVAMQWGAKPMVRSDGYAADNVGTQAVMQEALRRLVPTVSAGDYACCIYATAPMMTAQDLRTGYHALTQTSWYPSYAIPVAPYAAPPQRSFALAGDGSLLVDNPEQMGLSSKELPPRYHDVGQWYWGRTSAFLRDEPLFSSHTIGVPIPRTRAQDIDTEEDWRAAEYK